MGKGVNRLTQKQIYQLCKWLESQNKKELQKGSKRLAFIASKDLNFFITDNNINKAISIIHGSIETTPSEKTEEDEFDLKFSDGSGCIVQHSLDGGEFHTVVFLPEGPVINSYPEKIYINLEKKDKRIEIGSYDFERDVFDTLHISKDQNFVSRSIEVSECVEISENKIDQ